VVIAESVGDDRGGHLLDVLPHGVKVKNRNNSSRLISGNSRRRSNSSSANTRVATNLNLRHTDQQHRQPSTKQPRPQPEPANQPRPGTTPYSLFFVPVRNPETFDENDIVLGSDSLAVPGVLSLPRWPGPHPAVVLLAGG
jgi:hypothetical protein